MEQQGPGRLAAFVGQSVLTHCRSASRLWAIVVGLCMPAVQGGAPVQLLGGSHGISAVGMHPAAESGSLLHLHNRCRLGSLRVAAVSVVLHCCETYACATGGHPTGLVEGRGSWLRWCAGGVPDVPPRT
jgi:hypothetical protein